MSTNVELRQMIEKLLDESQLKYFKGIIMRDEFSQLDPPWNTEYGIYNLQTSTEKGSHWCCWARKDNNWYHACPYGGDACKELLEYTGAPVISSTFQLQEFGETCCGPICIIIIYLLSEGISFEYAILSLVVE